MAIEFYSTDDDLVMIRPNILELGISCWEDQHKEAFKVINRILIGRWYKQMALEYGVDWRETEFDPELVDKDQLVRLSCYKTLEFAYLYLMKDSPEPDGFEREMTMFQKWNCSGKDLPMNCKVFLQKESPTIGTKMIRFLLMKDMRFLEDVY